MTRVFMLNTFFSTPIDKRKLKTLDHTYNIEREGVEMKENLKS